MISSKCVKFNAFYSLLRNVRIDPCKDCLDIIYSPLIFMIVIGLDGVILFIL